jgi:hypothetical protein
MTVAEMLDSLSSLWVRYQSHPKRPDVIAPASSALEAGAQLSYCALSPRGWGSQSAAQERTGPYRYVPVFDFDGAGAVRDCEAFCAQVLGAFGVVRDRDYTVCVSSPGRRKVWFRGWLPERSDWAAVFRWLTARWKFSYPSLDAAQATQALARWIGSKHRTKPFWQVPIGPTAQDSECLLSPSPMDRLAWSLLPLLDHVPRWVAHYLDEFLFHRAVGATPSRRPNSKAWRSVNLQSVLDANGIDYTQVHGSGWLRLPICPSCGRAKVAALSPSRYLSCFRESCAAHPYMPVTAKGGGGWARLMGVDPAKVRPSKTTFVHARRRQADRLPLGEARARVGQAIEAAWTSDVPTILRVTPGGGKSTMTVKSIVTKIREKKTSERWLYLCPTKELAQEVSHMASSASYGQVLPLVLEGRNDRNCYLIDKVQAATSVGHRAGQAVCPGCPFKDECKYLRQMRQATKAAFVVSVWEHAYLVGSYVNPHHIVIDEFAERLFFRTTHVSEHALMTWVNDSGTDQDIRDACALLLRVLARVSAEYESQGKPIDYPKEWRGQALRALLRSGGTSYEKVIQRCSIACVDAQLVPAGSLAGDSVGEILALPPLSVAQLILDLDGELRSNDERVTTTTITMESGGRFAFTSRRVADLNLADKLALVLDGYGRERVYSRALAGHVRLEAIDVEMGCRVHQVPMSSSRNAFRRDVKKVLDVGRAAVRTLVCGGHRVLVLTHKPWREEIEGWGVDVRHFGQGVGTNAYRTSHSAVVVLGTPRKPNIELRAMAAALCAGEPAFAEGAADHDTTGFADDRLQEVLEICREDEMAQGVHRIGLTIPGHRLKEVVVIGQVEIGEIPPPDMLPVKDLLMAERIAVFASERGWWCSVMRDMVVPAAVVATPTKASRKAQASYDRALPLAVTGLPLVVDDEGDAMSPEIFFEGRFHGLGNVYGNLDKARAGVLEILNEMQASELGQREFAALYGAETGLIEL